MENILTKPTKKSDTGYSRYRTLLLNSSSLKHGRHLLHDNFSMYNTSNSDYLH